MTRLAVLLAAKERQLTLAGTLGQRVLAQQMELEERIRQLQERGEDNDGSEAISELEDLTRSWELELDGLVNSWADDHQQKDFNGSSAKDPVHVAGPIDDPAPSSAPITKAQARRQKNAQHRTSDVEFAFEIGSGLLTEVRRLQSLLGERDQHIQTLQGDNSSLESSIEQLKKALKAQEESADKWRDENWNLEVKIQGLQEKVTEVTSERDTAKIDLRKLQKKARETEANYESVKTQSEKVTKELEELRVKHEVDVANFRKQNASSARERSELQTLINSLQTDLATAKRRLPRWGSPVTPGSLAPPQSHDAADDSLAHIHTPAHLGDDGDVFTVPTTGGPTGRRKGEALDPKLFARDEETVSEIGDHSPEPSPSKPGLLGAPTPEQDKAVAHASRTIRGLREVLAKERSKREQLLRFLRKSGLKLPQTLAANLDDEDDEMAFEDDEAVDIPEKQHTMRQSVAGRGRGRGRGRGLSLAQRFSLVAGRAGSEEVSSDEEIFDEEDADVSKASVDSQGLDPTFSKSTIGATAAVGKPSPLRQSTMGRSRRGRGRLTGSASTRPDSLIAAGVGGDLAKELGMTEEEESEDPTSRDSLDFLVDAAEQDNDIPEPQVREVEKIVEVIKEVPVEVIKEIPVEVVKEVIKEVPVEVVKEVIKEVPVEVVREVIKEVPVEKVVEREVAVQKEVPVEKVVVKEVPVEKIVEKLVPVEKIVEVVKEVKVEVEKIVEVVKEVPVKVVEVSEVIKEVPVEKIVEVPVEVIKEVETIVEVQPPKRHMVDVDVQASFVAHPTTSANRITPLASFLAIPAQGAETEDEGDETETGAETETEYEDALQTPALDQARSGSSQGARGGPPPSSFNFNRLQARSGTDGSTDDFHSMMTISDYAGSSSDDEMPPKSISAAPSLKPATPTGYESSATQSGRSLYQSALEESDAEPARPYPIQKRERKVTLRPKREILKVDASVGTDDKENIMPQPAKELKIAGTQTDPVLPSEKHQLFHFVSGPSSPAPTAGGTIGKGHRTSTLDRERRESIESLLSQSVPYTEDVTPRAIPPVDKSRPPILSAVPPPPSLPPPSGNMGPPSFIPQRMPRGGQTDVPPPRPTSPPPRELIERATTPSLYGTTRVRHTSGSSAGAYASVGRRPSTSSSIRDRAHTAMTYLTGAPPTSNISLSPRSSLDSARLQPPLTPSKRRGISQYGAPGGGLGGPGNGTDPSVIHAITQSMIGEFMWKYTRKSGFGRKSFAALGGNGGDSNNGERRHRRFFWVHPYTKTLYWSEGDPGSVTGEGSNAKSAYIEGVRSVLDPNPVPLGLCTYSVIITTPHREMKFTAQNKERHDIWMSALKYLLSRPNQPSPNAPAPQSPMSAASDLPSSEGHPQREGRPLLHASPQSQRSAYHGGNTTTPRGQRSRSLISLTRGSSVGKRSGTPAAEYLRYGHLESPYSPTRSFVDVGGPRGRGRPTGMSDDEYEYFSGEDLDGDGELDFELHGSDDENLMELGGGPGFEGLENVRACCDGKHTVGGHHHHHHHDEPKSPLKASLRPEDRPSSPAWSFRSRAGSTSSGTGGLFGGKLKFGSRREASKKSSTAPPE